MSTQTSSKHKADTMRHWVTFLGSLVLTLVPLSGLSSRALASEDDAEVAAAVRVSYAENRGYRLLHSDVDNLSQGQAVFYHFTLYRDVHYVILACGDNRAADIDIYLYDENNNLIDRDNSTDNSPVVDVTPRWTGRFTVVVKMYRAYGVGSYAMAVLGG
jgi:hypothetical protein